MKRSLLVLMISIVAVTSIVAVFVAVGRVLGQLAPFSMQVFPAHIGDAIAGQRCIFLVVAADEGSGRSEGKAVNISAIAPASAVTVEPQAITPGEVAEITVIPFAVSTGNTLEVTVYGEREGLNQTETSTLVVREGEDLMGDVAAEVRDRFIPWLATNYPELGIIRETEWTGTIVRPNYEGVFYYLFFSEDWEMGVSRYVTLPPRDSARIYLRHRTTEKPSYAFEVSSWGGGVEPHAINPPESVWR